MEINNKPLKTVLYASILLLWIGSMTYLFAARHARTVLTGTPAAASVSGSGHPSGVSEWMGLYMGAKKIGYDHEEIMPSKDGFSFKSRTFMRIMLMGEEKDITMVSDSETDGDYNLRSIDFSMKTSGIEIAAAGTFGGGVLSLDMKGPGGTSTRQIPLSGPVVDSDGIVMRVVKDGFGRSTYSFTTFDPTIQQELPVHVRVMGKETKQIMGSPVDTIKLEVTVKDMKETMWVTAQGETVEEISPLGFRAVLEPQMVALTKGWGSEPVDLISATAIKAAGLTVTYPAGVRDMSIYVSGISEEESIPASGFQSREGRLITVRTPADIGTYTLPYRGHDATVVSALKPGPLADADAPEVVSTAKGIIHGETDAKKAAELINQWVYARVQSSFMVALPRAVDLLHNPQGDCKAHTILFTALARAVGLPAKMAMGIVLMPDGYFYYHAWPLVYLNGWVPVDPTFGEFPADATHVMLAEGSLDNWMDILGVVGRLKITVMKAQAN